MDHDQFTLTAVDTTSIQQYVFGSNLLRENVGASELVRQATGRWLLEEVKEIAGDAHNIKRTDPMELVDGFRIEDSLDDWAAEVIYAETGSALIIFRSLKAAKSFACNLTRRCLLASPGLSLVVAHRPFEWPTKGALFNCNQALQSTELADRKDSHLPSAPLLGLGVTAACQATGLVAVRTDEDLKPPMERARLISSETTAKLKARPEADKRLAEVFEPELKELRDRLFKEPGEESTQKLVFAYDIDNLARMFGEESYVAIVHADANRMGEHLQSIDDDLPSREYADTLRKFSKNINKAGKTALKHAVRMIFNAISRDQDSGKFVLAGEIPLQQDPTHIFLPFRPLVFGGDDVTFICNAQIGMSLAAEYLRAFEIQAKTHTGKDIYSRAGIAMVKMHYPFARAYKLSETLSTEAKKALRNTDASALDWHFATTGLSGSLSAIRHREYQDGALLMRPLTLHPAANDQSGRAWFGRIEKLVRQFQGKLGDSEKDPGGQPWHEKRNKVKALREALRGGPAEVERMLTAYKINSLPELLPASDEHRRTGWNGSQCVYFDAIELTDQYIDLREFQS
jgi:hypothetical protein